MFSWLFKRLQDKVILAVPAVIFDSKIDNETTYEIICLPLRLAKRQYSALWIYWKHRKLINECVRLSQSEF